MFKRLQCIFKGEGYTFKHTYVIIRRILFLVGWWTEDLSSLLVVGQKPPSAPCHLGLFRKAAHSIAAWFPQSWQVSGREVVQDGSYVSLLSYFFFFYQKQVTRSSPHSRGKYHTKEWVSGGRDHRTILEVPYHSPQYHDQWCSLIMNWGVGLSQLCIIEVRKWNKSKNKWQKEPMWLWLVHICKSSCS